MLKILFISDPLWLKTGLSRNLKEVLKELYKTGKYELIHYCQQGTNQADPRLKMYPWKSVGSIKPDPEFIAKINKDPNEARAASYGGHLFEEIVKEEKPDVVVMSNDIWAFPLEKFYTEWAQKINLVSHITIDSLPVNEQAFEQARRGHFYSWAKFGEREISKIKTNYSIGTIGGAINSEIYKPLSTIEKSELRRKFKIDGDCKIFVYVARNQLRKKFDSLLRGFSQYKRQNPTSKCKLLLHTNWTEGWKLKDMIGELGLNPADILATYVCKNCQEFEIKPYSGEGLDCPYCGAEKSQNSASISHGVPDYNMRNIYGIADASISAFTSGGLEMQNIEAMMMGLPLATSTYSCGEDYIECKDVFPISHVETREIHSNFIKAEPNVNDISKFIGKIDKMDDSEISKVGRRSREWAIKKYDSKSVSKQWQNIFDKFNKVDYSNMVFEQNEKNADFNPDLNLEGNEFLYSLYLGFLGVQNPDQEGMNHWSSRLERGESKQNIAQIFKNIAAQDEKFNLEKILPNNGKKNFIWVIVDSADSCYVHSSKFPEYRKKYKEYNFIIVTSPEFREIFKGNPNVDFVVNHHPIFDNESYILGLGQEKSYADAYLKIENKNLYGQLN